MLLYSFNGEKLSEYVEEITTYDKLVESLRSLFLDYTDKLVQEEIGYEKKLKEILNAISSFKGNLKDVEPYEPRSFVVLDGASATIDIEAGYIGAYAALAIMFPEMRRIYYNDSYGIIPSDPSLLRKTPERVIFNRLIDLVRERKVMELAYHIIKDHRPELILLDGSLLPTPRTGLEDKSEELRREYNRYSNSICSLHEEAKNRGVLLVGFVKRARSKILKRASKELIISMKPEIEEAFIGLPDIYDIIITDILLGQNEYFPMPPINIRHSFLHEIQVASIFIKSRGDMTPYRIDIGGIATKGDRLDIDLIVKSLGFIKNYMTSLGIPFPILKVDEEVKLSRRLIREIYDDMRYRYLNRRKGKMLTIKAIWGEYL